MPLWYQEHKNGFVGLLTTICVSLITALATLYVMERISGPFAQPPRVIYEIEPKSQPGP